MDNLQRISNLQSLGYNECEASFVCQAGLHSGYFLRRQYSTFLGKVPGYSDVALGERAVRLGHARVTTMRHNRMLYHLYSKPFYAAMGEEDNRNRRDREPQAIRRRLMMLDFALSQRTLRFFPTESEKLAFFGEELGISEDPLPRRLYRSAENRSSTLRYFVDKLPIYIDPSENRGALTVHFCYVDEGLHSTSGLEQHLKDYRSLFARLGSVEVVYVACAPDGFAAAERAFAKLFGPANRPPADPLAQRIIDHFKVRDAYERRDMSGLNQAKLIQLRADRAEFSDPKYEQLFVRWKSDGDASVVAAFSPESTTKATQAVRFRTHLLPFRYELFGTLTRSKSQGAGDGIRK